MSNPNSSQPQGQGARDGRDGNDSRDSRDIVPNPSQPAPPEVELHQNPTYGDEIDPIELTDSSPATSQAETAELNGRSPAAAPESANALHERLLALRDRERARAARPVTAAAVEPPLPHPPLPTPEAPPTDPIHSTGRTTAALGSQVSTQSVHQTLREWKGVDQKPPTYSGDNNTLANLIAFFLSLAGFFRLNLGWEEAAWIPFFPHTLTGKAQTWYQELKRAGTSPTTWQQFQTMLRAQYLGPRWTDRVQSVLTQPSPWGMQQAGESITDFRCRWTEVHDLYTLGTSARLPPRLEMQYFISHLLQPYRDLVETQKTFQLCVPGSSSTTQDLDNLMDLLTHAESDPNFLRGRPTPSLNIIHGNQQGHYTSNQQRNNGRRQGITSNRGSMAPRRQTHPHQPPPNRRSTNHRQNGPAASQQPGSCYRCLAAGVQRPYHLCKRNQCPTANKFCGSCGTRCQSPGRCTNGQCPASRSGTQAP